jgi:cullin-associated NEDD8-dissociated protein 1
LPEDSSEFDDILAPSFASFLGLMKDPDLVSKACACRCWLTRTVQDVRRIALTTLNSAAHHKLMLVRNQLSLLLPLVYDETVVSQDHVRIVTMGPFKHKVDDSLEVRKVREGRRWELV